MSCAEPPLPPDVLIEIWSDVICPFCYLGRRNLEQALDGFERRDEVEVVWRSFELDPTSSPDPQGPLVDALAKKYGMSREQAIASQEQIAAASEAVGLTFNWEQAQPVNTFDAHRLIHLAAKHDLGSEADERLKRAYFSDGEVVSDHETLVRLGADIGLPEDEVREMLGSDQFADAVRGDEAQAQQIGVSGVPFTVLGRRLAVSGAQPPEVFTQALQQAFAESA